MIRADVHVHSSFSTDSETAMENQVRAAIAAGINVLCFTDHIDYDYPVPDTVYDFNVAEYQREIERLRDIYRKNIEILMGVELGMQKHLGVRYKKLLDDYPFDYSIGSQHLVCASGSVYLHPLETSCVMQNSIISRKYVNGEWVEVFPEAEELMEILTGAANACGGIVEFSDITFGELPMPRFSRKE